MKTIWTNGTFDLITFGHCKLFEFAKSFGDYLVVGIDSDERVRQRKGEGRPIHNIHQRKFNLQSIKYIDKVVVFETDFGLEWWVSKINPDYLIIGHEYKDKKIIGSQYAKEIVFFDMPRVTSSTELIKLI